jgi:hypothetical protein
MKVNFSGPQDDVPHEMTGIIFNKRAGGAVKI